jgi:hypothetical protein
MVELSSIIVCIVVDHNPIAAAAAAADVAASFAF